MKYIFKNDIFLKEKQKEQLNNKLNEQLNSDKDCLVLDRNISLEAVIDEKTGVTVFAPPPPSYNVSNNYTDRQNTEDVVWKVISGLAILIAIISFFI